MHSRARPGLLLLALLLAPLVGACSSGGASPPPTEDLRVRGPFAVGFEVLSLVDVSRPTTDAGFTHRPVPVYVWYPVDAATVNAGTPEASYPLDPFYGQAPVSVSSDWERLGVDRAYQGPTPSAKGPFPVVVYSHGFGVPQFAAGIGARLASHGFVFAAVLHLGDEAMFDWYPPQHTWRRILFDRPRDMSFALTELLARNETPGDLLHGLIRADQVAASGFSMGGYAAMTQAAGDDDVCDIPDVPMNDPIGPAQPGDPCVPTPADPRFRAIVPMDGANQFLHVVELKRVTVPSLGIGEDWGSLARNGGTPPWQARQHALFAGRPALRVDVLNTAHDGSFGDRCTLFPVLAERVPGWETEEMQGLFHGNCVAYTPWTEVRDTVGEYTVAFLRTVLAGETAYADMLTPAWALSNEPLVQLFEQERVPASEITVDWPADATYYRHMSEVP